MGPVLEEGARGPIRQAQGKLSTAQDDRAGFTRLQSGIRWEYRALAGEILNPAGYCHHDIFFLPLESL